MREAPESLRRVAQNGHLEPFWLDLGVEPFLGQSNLILGGVDLRSNKINEGSPPRGWWVVRGAGGGVLGRGERR